MSEKELEYGLNPRNLPAKEPEYVNIASSMAREIVERFNPDEQNSALRIIKDVIAKSRAVKIAEAEKQLAYLKETFQELS